jgi:hypothetical protein
MTETKVISVVCPIDGHECSVPACVEYEGTQEQPCVGASMHLAEVTRRIGKINILLHVYEDPSSLTQEELGSGVNVTEALLDVSERLGVNQNLFFTDILNRIEKF